MTPSDYQKLTRLLLPLSADELDEVRRWITHLAGIARCGQVLAANVQRPGKRGKRWVKTPAKRKAEK